MRHITILEGHVRVCIYDGFFQEDVPECIYTVPGRFKPPSTKVLALRMEVPKRSSGRKLDGRRTFPPCYYCGRQIVSAPRWHVSKPRRCQCTPEELCAEPLPLVKIKQYASLAKKMATTSLKTVEFVHSVRLKVGLFSTTMSAICSLAG
jgi:hypothetical protein